MGEEPISIGVIGCAGRMGRMLVVEIAAAPQASLAGGVDRPGHDWLGRDIGELAGMSRLGLILGDDPQALVVAADVVIDFTAPQATLRNARLAAEAGKALVAGATGLSEADKQVLAAAGQSAPIVFAPNMSLGVNLLLALVEQVAGALDADYDIEVVEMHHRHKVDAPSGTALALGEAAARGRGVSLADCGRYAREGQTGARPRGEIGFATLRGGDVVGDHTVVFAADGERIALTHKASRRALFARGAVRAALWVADKPPGLYGMKDVLGLG